MDASVHLSDAPDRPSLQVMIVEDHPGVLASMEAMVESWKEIEITSVGDFMAAARWIKKLDRLDLLLCDVCLPSDMDGSDVAKLALAVHPMVAIVLFSADLRSDIQGMSERYSFLQKPFGRDELFRQIDDAFIRARKPAPVDLST
jgi:DNA-binding NtrC family response regulator